MKRICSVLGVPRACCYRHQATAQASAERDQQMRLAPNWRGTCPGTSWRGTCPGTKQPSQGETLNHSRATAACTWTASPGVPSMFECTACGAQVHARIGAARNILARGRKTPVVLC